MNEELNNHRFFSSGQPCFVKKEMKCNGDSEILHKIVRDTTRISSCFSEFRVVSRTIWCTYSSISESPLHFTSFLTVCFGWGFYCTYLCPGPTSPYYNIILLYNNNNEIIIIYNINILLQDCASIFFFFFHSTFYIRYSTLLALAPLHFQFGYSLKAYVKV